MKEQTLIILKPDAVQKGIVGICLKRFEDSGLIIKQKHKLELDRKFVDKLYKHLEGKISEKLLENTKKWMLSDYVVAAVLEGGNAIARARKICGKTNPAEAGKGTLRGDFSDEDLLENAKHDIETHNVVHSSGSREEAKQEISLFRKLVLENKK